MTDIVCHRNSGVKAGVVTAPGFYLHGLVGAAFLKHHLNVNFATAAQSNVTTPRFTAGIGGEYQPPSWQLAGHPGLGVRAVPSEALR